MPEGPELYKAAQFLNKVGSDFLFSKIRYLNLPSAKHPAVPWTHQLFRISAEARGKEIRISLTESTDDNDGKYLERKPPDKLNILLTFGMAGRFAFTNTNNIQKHSLLMFDTTDDRTFSFVDTRHFGRWYITDDWSPASKRGPSIISEYEAFRSHVLDSLGLSIFSKPICEVMLDQRYFSSIGNYLRAEILYRLDINPYLCARTVLEGLPPECDTKQPDILKMCHDVCWEVIGLKGSGKPYDPDQIYGDNGVFEEWLQCYMKLGMGNTIDAKGRTMWHRTKYGKGKFSRHSHKISKVKVSQAEEKTSAPKSKAKGKRTNTNNSIEPEGAVKLEPLDVLPKSQCSRRKSARLIKSANEDEKENYTSPTKSPYFSYQ